MLTSVETWAELERRFRISTGGSWRASATMRPGRRLEAQIFSSSSLVNVHEMGAFSIIRHGAHIGGVRIGRFTAIGAGFVCAQPEHPTDAIGTSSVFLKDYSWARGGDGFYDVPLSGGKLVNRPVTIGSDVWVGRDVYVRGGISIGHGAIIAARSVVTRDVPPYSVVAGIPAKPVRQRFHDEVVSALLKLRWWDLDPGWLAEVDQGDIDACVAHLRRSRKFIPKLRPKTVVFTESGYEVV